MKGTNMNSVKGAETRFASTRSVMFNLFLKSMAASTHRPVLAPVLISWARRSAASSSCPVPLSPFSSRLHAPNTGKSPMQNPMASESATRFTSAPFCNELRMGRTSLACKLRFARLHKESMADLTRPSSLPPPVRLIFARGTWPWRSFSRVFASASSRAFVSFRNPEPRPT